MANSNVEINNSIDSNKKIEKATNNDDKLYKNNFSNSSSSDSDE